MSTSTQTAAVKKFNIADFLMSIIPLFIMLVLNTIATVPAVFIGMMQCYKEEGFNITDTSALLASKEAQTALTIGFIVYALVSILIFYIWYKKSFLKNQPVISNKEIFTPKNIAITIISALGISAVINFFILGVSILAPELIEQYSDTMNAAGLGSNILTTVIYACILGPIAEELMFRGVTQAYLTRSNAHPVVVVVFQALLFGIAHMNLIQSTYAVLLGIFLGFLRYKTGNIRITILAHIAFNVFGTFGLGLMSKLPDLATYIILGALIAASIVCLTILGRTPARSIASAEAKPAPVRA